MLQSPCSQSRLFGILIGTYMRHAECQLSPAMCCRADSTPVAVKWAHAGSEMAEALEQEAAIYGRLQHMQVRLVPYIPNPYRFLPPWLCCLCRAWLYLSCSLQGTARVVSGTCCSHSVCLGAPWRLGRMTTCCLWLGMCCVHSMQQGCAMGMSDWRISWSAPAVPRGKHVGRCGVAADGGWVLGVWPPDHSSSHRASLPITAPELAPTSWHQPLELAHSPLTLPCTWHLLCVLAQS